MPRVPRIHIEGALYYITSRGDNNREIYKDDQDYVTYIELISKYKNVYGFKLFAFSLLPNHAHLLIELREDLTISQIMHDINSSYIKYFNNKYNRKGHLLQERYKLILIEKGPYLLPMTAYIHFNPFTLKLSGKLEEYPYSSLPHYTNPAPDNKAPAMQIALIEETQEIAEFLQQKTYAEFLSSLDKKELELIARQIHKKRVLGSKRFLEQARNKINKNKLQSSSKKQILNKKFILAGMTTVILLIITNVVLFGMNRRLKDDFSDLRVEKEKEFNKKLANEKSFIRKDLHELHKANMVSYDAMARRLEIEKQKVKKLEQKL